MAPHLPSKKTIAGYSLRLLARVEFYERRDCPGVPVRELVDGVAYNSVGLSYAAVLAKVRGRFPRCNASVESIRWYATQARGRSELIFPEMTLPQRRPRPRWTRGDG